jgi:biotin-dependent carboxylase-like uncharacterized protein
MLECQAPGLRATVQDAGRPGHAHEGVSLAGAADRLALAAANLLCGNDPGAPALEMPLVGATFSVARDCLVALTGAEMDARVPEEHRALEVDASHRLRAGTSLVLDAATSGTRAYLALEGGVRAERVLGSASTDPWGGFGGLAGRPLAAGDVLRAVTPSHPGSEGRRWPGPGPASGVWRGGGPVLVSVLVGPHASDFPEAARAGLLDTTWRVSARSDRTGIRLEGAALAASRSPELVSLPVIPGSVQVPSGGEPIVLGPDAPTVGGYPVLAVVCRVDLALLGQLGAGDEIRLVPVGAAAARARLRAEQERLDGIRAALT